MSTIGRAKLARIFGFSRFCLRILGGCTPVLFAVGCATPPGSRPDHRQPHSRERSSSSHPPLANVPQPLGRPTPPPFVPHPRHSVDPDIVWRLTDPQRTKPRHPTRLSEWGHRLPGPNWWKERQRRETVNLSLFSRSCGKPPHRHNSASHSTATPPEHLWGGGPRTGPVPAAPVSLPGMDSNR
jgi:hypothetical protein